MNNKQILGLPIYHAHNVRTDLIPDLQASIEVMQLLKSNWDNKHKSKLSIYTESGEHKFNLKQDPMKGVDGWQDLRRSIKTHVMSYLDETQPIDYELQSELGTQLRNELNSFWHNYAWYTYFDETDSYPWHSHGQYYLVATYYVRADEEHAPLQFKSPLSDMYTSWSMGTKNTNLETVIQPKTGDLIIWPAWLEHQIPSTDTIILNHSSIKEVNKYKDNRISITNCFVKPHTQFLYDMQKNKEE
jgi:uncharacterized protein (TIGR02466 family)|tara:strand:+ start:199 stop:930 length:732 start_codon:yes stop_codon:yes gene_type:complete